MWPNNVEWSALSEKNITLEKPHGLSKATKYNLTKIECGQLKLPSGRLICCDPFTSMSKFHNSFLNVPTGEFDVVLTLADVSEALDGSHTRVAYASIIFQKGKKEITRKCLELTFDGESSGKSLSDCVYEGGFSVDAGTACFVDAESLVEGMPNEEVWHDDIFENESDECWFELLDSPKNISKDVANVILPKSKEKNNVILFSSGWGDGTYPVIGGYDELGELVAVHIDFFVIPNPDNTDTEEENSNKKVSKPWWSGWKQITKSLKKHFCNNEFLKQVFAKGWIYSSKEDLIQRLESSDNNAEQRTIQGIIPPIENGKKWLYQYTKKYQPRTAEILLKGSDPFVYEEESLLKSFDLGNDFHLVQKLLNGYISFNAHPKGSNPYDEDYKVPYHDMLRALPKEIYMAYYYHFDGIHPVIGDIIISARKTKLPSKRQYMQCMEDYLRSIDGFNKKNKSWIAENFPGKMHNSVDKLADPSGTYWGTNLYTFLDTRTDKHGKEGDVLLFKRVIDDKVIYHIKDGDVENMRILSDYVKAIDRYCEHVLLGKEERFDFLPYTSDFVSPASLYPEEVYEITKEEIMWTKADDWSNEGYDKWDKFASYREKFFYSVP